MTRPPHAPAPGMRWARNEFGWVETPIRRVGKTPEGNLKKRCYAALTKWAAEHRHMPIKMVRVSVGFFESQDGRPYAIGTVGAGDFLVAIGGTTVMVETKSAKGRQSDGQRKMEADWTATGNIYLVVRQPSDLIDALDQIAAQRGRGPFG